MTTIKEVYELAVSYINNFLKDEFKDQGHHLTGQFERSLDADIQENGNTATMEGFGLLYGTFVNQGVPAKSASYKQVPFLIRYFIQRGLQPKEAKAAAFATVTKWMKEGMSTEASKRFSATGQRQHFVEEAFENNDSRLDSFMGKQFDNMVDDMYQNEKSETI